MTGAAARKEQPEGRRKAPLPVPPPRRRPSRLFAALDRLRRPPTRQER